MKIYFVRHGETQYNKDGLITGHDDAPLTEEGIRQVKNVIFSIPSDCTAIYSSDLVRCRQTTAIFNEKLLLPVTYDVRLRERDFGSLTGKKIADLDPIAIEKDKKQQYDYRAYGGESVENVKERILSCIADIRRKKKDGKILVITSAGIIRLLHHLFKGEVREKIKNSSVHEFEFPSRD
ncbi:MAG: histidine phosphatase family protein [Candidatus Sungbacteria bacterium]|nr:histidine phosphatase family protein [Candidatus Sungbacteria bacterium]